MAPFSPLPPVYSSHSRSLRPPQPSRPFAHIFGQAKPHVKRYTSPSQVLCGSATESKSWMFALGLLCFAVVGWLVSLPEGEALSRGVLFEFHVETSRIGAFWDVTGPRGIDVSRAVGKDAGEMVSPYAPGEIELGKKRKVIFGHPSPDELALPFDMIVPPQSEPGSPSPEPEPEDQRPTPQVMDDRGLDRPQASHSPWASVGPLSAEQEISNEGGSPGSEQDAEPTGEPVSSESRAEPAVDQASGDDTAETRPRQLKSGRRGRERSKKR